MTNRLPAGAGIVPRARGMVERGDGAIYYEMAGSGPPIVFAHGLGGSHMSWWQQVPEFVGRYTCITFTHRGFHPSRHDGEVVTPDLFAGDLLALLDHLQIERANLVAQSMGGWSALETAIEHPERVAKLVMSATSGRIDPHGVADLTAWNGRAKRAGPDFEERGIHPAMGARAAREQPALHLLYRQLDEASGFTDKQGMRQRLMQSRTRGAEAVDALKMPVLWLAGEEDVVFPPEASIALAARMGSKPAIIPQSGHSPYFQRAEQFNRIVAGFFAG
jgi:3-oxoadipate enol-lactonase